MTSKFHNISTADLADRIGAADADVKARQEALDEMKDEFKRRGVNVARGSTFVVSVSTSTSKRLDTKRLRADLGDALDGYEVASETTRLTIKAAPKLDEAA